MGHTVLNILCVFGVYLLKKINIFKTSVVQEPSFYLHLQQWPISNIIYYKIFHCQNIFNCWSCIFFKFFAVSFQVNKYNFENSPYTFSSFHVELSIYFYIDDLKIKAATEDKLFVNEMAAQSRSILYVFCCWLRMYLDGVLK